jgi:hypothetical protein
MMAFNHLREGTNMFRKLAALAIGLIFAGTTGCIQVMKKEQFEGPMVNLGDQLGKINADYDLKSKTYKAVTAKSSTPKADPYPELGQMLGQMYAAIAPLAKIRERMHGMEKEFTDLRQGRPDISSDRPQWQPFLKLYDEMKAMIPKVNEGLQAYSAPSNRFADLANKANVRALKTADVKGQLKGMLDSAEQSMKQVRSQTDDLRKRLDERKALTLGLDQQKERREGLNKIDALSGEVDTLVAGLRKKAAAFEASLAGQDEIYSGPGLPSAGIVDEVSKGVAQINGIFNQIRAEGERLNKL